MPKKTKGKPKRKTSKGHSREDFNQVAFRTIQETIKRSQ